MWPVLHSALGLIAIPLIALVFSENRKAIPIRTVLAALALQLALGVLLLKMPGSQSAFLALNKVVLAIENSTRAGTSFVFGYLGGGDAPFDVKNPGAMYLFGFRGLWLVLVMSALSSLLFYWKILPMVVRGFAWVLRRTIGVGGAEGLGLAANVFIGMIEAPLFIRPYLARISRGELFALMTGGMATIAGTVMILYASFLSSVLPNALGHLLAASIISAPAAVAIARIMVPAAGEPTQAQMTDPNPAAGAMEAVANGAADGMKLFINIIAMLVTFVALVHLANICLGWFPAIKGEPLTLQRILGSVMAPVVWLIGIPWSECQAAGSLMGVKTILNELLAYLSMAGLPAGTLSPRSTLIMTYAMCGFANLGSLGIMIGGLGMMAPERRGEIVQLGVRSIIAGTLATLMTGSVAGVLMGS